MFAAFTALDFFLEDRGFLFDLAEAVLDGVVGGVEVEGDLAVVDLWEGAMSVVVRWEMGVGGGGGGVARTLMPVAMMLATTRCQVSWLSQLTVPFAMGDG